MSSRVLAANTALSPPPQPKVRLHYAEAVTGVPAGLTLVFTGACTVAADLARSHRLPEARWLPPVFALLIGSNLILYATGAGAPAHALLAVAFAAQLSLTVRLYRIPYTAGS